MSGRRSPGQTGRVEPMVNSRPAGLHSAQSNWWQRRDGVPVDVKVRWYCGSRGARQRTQARGQRRWDAPRPPSPCSSVRSRRS